MRLELPSGTPAELALPPGDVPLRGLVVAPDIGGLRPLFDDLAAGLAADHAWAVCAVEPFPGREHLSVEERLAACGQLDDDRVLGDLAAAADVIEQHADVSRTAVLGFCMGGMYALKAAGTGRFDRTVSFYGMVRIPDQWKGAGQREPLEYLVRQQACPTLAIFGGRDHWTPADDVDALRNSTTNVTVRVYPDADHGFVHDPARPAHRPDDAADAWRWAVEFLA